MANHERNYSELFDYLSADETSPNKTGLIVFGRKDLLVARKAFDIMQSEGTPWAIITGGVGKDSGDLQVSEAEYLSEEIDRLRQEKSAINPPTYLDTKATNGGENTRNSLAIMQGVPGFRHSFDTGVTTVAHATSSRRLAETMKHTAHKQGVPLNVFRRATDYDFDPSNPADQNEAKAEMLRLVNWPGKDFLLPQDDLPEDLVDFVTDK